MNGEVNENRKPSKKDIRSVSSRHKGHREQKRAFSFNL